MPSYIYQQAVGVQDWPFSAALSPRSSRWPSPIIAFAIGALSRRYVRGRRCSVASVDRVYSTVVGAITGFGMLLVQAPTMVVLVISFTRRHHAQISAAELVAALVCRAPALAGDRRARADQPQGRRRRRSSPRCWAAQQRSGLQKCSRLKIARALWMRCSCRRWCCPRWHSACRCSSSSTCSASACRRPRWCFPAIPSYACPS